MQMGFCLPSVIPVVVSNFNWTPVMVGLILGAVLIVWYLPSFGARHWYHGKAHLSEDTSVVSLHVLLIIACVKLLTSVACGRAHAGPNVCCANPDLGRSPDILLIKSA